MQARLLTPALVLVAAMAAPAHAASPARPRLVVLVVVDQLRADHLVRDPDRLLPATDGDGAPGGFRWITEGGAWWPWATHDIAQAMTGPGHASIATGAWPARSGIALNRWRSSETGAKVYCVEDRTARNLPDDGQGKDLPIGLANLRVPTLGDALRDSGIGGTVLAVSLKDRSAALLGGFGATDVVWWDSAALRWTTSTTWAPSGALPAWAAALNTPDRVGRDLFTSLEGDGAVVEAALAAVDAHALGQDDRPDLLAVSFSTFDHLGHIHGPDAPEMAELLVATDAAIATLLRGLSGRLGGLDEVVVALTADHGAPPTPEAAGARGLRAGRTGEVGVVDELEVALTEALGEPEGGSWITEMVRGNVWFRPDAVRDPAVRYEAEEATRRLLRGVPGVEDVVTASDIEALRLPLGPVGMRVGNQYRAGVSGDVVALSSPYWFSNDEPSGVSHMTGWSYDVTVPLAIRGAGVIAGRFASPARVIDLAPTLCWLLNILPPAAAEGRVLSEAVRHAVTDSPEASVAPSDPRRSGPRSRKATP